MQNAFLVGSQVYLRPLERADAPHFVPWMNDVEIWSNLLSYRPISGRQETEFLERLGTAENEIVLGIVTRAEDQLIGAAGLDGIDWKNRQTRFGILIGDRSQWGRGHGTEATRLLTDYAFAVLNLNRVWLHVYEYNQRGRGAYARAGFVPEGVLRQAHYHDGRYWDVISMALLRAEWEARRLNAGSSIGAAGYGPPRSCRFFARTFSVRRRLGSTHSPWFIAGCCRMKNLRGRGVLLREKVSACRSPGVVNQDNAHLPDRSFPASP